MEEFNLAFRFNLRHKPGPSLSPVYGLVKHRLARYAVRFRVPLNEDLNVAQW
jgi:hypothetical protein